MTKSEKIRDKYENNGCQEWFEEARKKKILRKHAEGHRRKLYK